MRIVELTKETKDNLLNDLLKRSPNNYGTYEALSPSDFTLFTISATVAS